MPKNVNLNHFSMWRSEKKIVGLSLDSIKKGGGERKNMRKRENKAVYTTASVACGWAGAV